MTKNKNNELIQLILSKVCEDLSQDAQSFVDNQSHQIIEYLYGRYLAGIFRREWEIFNSSHTITGLEQEHGKSLALLFENESQKLKLEELNKKLTEAAIIHEKDLLMAQNIQRSLLFKTPPETNNYDIAFYYRPFASVSGDFYDFYSDENGMLTGLVMADVSGHGIASSLLTALAKPVFFRSFRQNLVDPLEVIIKKINMKISEMVHEPEHYLTAILLRFSENDCEYVNAAHPDIILKSAKTGECRAVRPDNREVQGSILGIPAIQYPFSSHKFSIENDDILLIFTDCLNESKDYNNEEFGQERIIEFLRKADTTNSAQQILNNIIEYFMKYTDGIPLKDDLSVIVLKKK